MLTNAALVLAVAALGGLALAYRVLRGHFAPWALSIVHALLGATGLVLVLIGATRGLGGTPALAALAALALAAAGGFTVASFHLRRTLPPKALVIVHALVAVAGFGLLLLAAVGG